MNPIRLTGLASGLDGDKLVRDMMKAESYKVDRVERQKTRQEWTQTAIRDIVKKARDFQTKYFDALSPTTNMKSSHPFSAFNYSVTSMGMATNAVSIEIKADAVRKENTIDRITQLATADTWKSNKSNIAVIQSGEVDLEQLKSGGDVSFTMTLGKSTKQVKMTESELSRVENTDQLAELLNTKIGLRFGEDFGNIVTAKDGRLSFEQSGTEIKLFKHGDMKFLNGLGIKNGVSSFDYKSKSIGSLFNMTDADFEDFEINGKKIELKASMTLDEMTKAINKSEAGVNLYFDSLADKVVLSSGKTGSVNNINIEDGSTAERVLSKLFGVEDLVDADGQLVEGTAATREKGKNAVLSLNGTEIVQSSNRFEVEGMIFNLNATSENAIVAKGEVDTEKVYNTIKEFVDDYNELIGEIEGKLSEEVFKGFVPLTEEERMMVSEKQAEMIEEKAKSGLLRGNRDLERMASAIRSAMVDVMGDGNSLRGIGIQSMSWKDKGRLSIDASKLKDAIRNDLGKVVETFTKESDALYTEENRKKERYDENGVMARLDDVLKDFTRTTRDSKGNKGSLVMLAGLEDDSSVITNKMSKEMREMDKKMDVLLERLAEREKYYYAMFAKMEAAMAQMQSQQASMGGLFGGMGGMMMR